MSTTRLANIFALSTLAILLCSFAPSQTLALTVQVNHLARQVPNHHGIARKKRGKRDGQCKPRSSTPPANTPASQPASTPASQPTSTPQSSPSPNNSPSPSSTQPPNTVATNTPTTGGKKFSIAWAMENDIRFKLITDPGRVACIFLWSHHIPDIVRESGVRISIMLWDDSTPKIDAFEQAVQAGGMQLCAGPNEVNEPTQANMSVERGVTLWRQHLAPNRDRCQLISPVTTSAPNGFDWMTEYFKSCPDCYDTLTYLAIHYYDIKLADLKVYVEKWKSFGKPLAMTEFACQNFNGADQPSMDQIWEFTVGAVEFFNSEDGLSFYAPFGFMDDLYNVNPANGLFSGSGLSDLGNYYVHNG